MRRERLAVGQNVASQLWEAERINDLAMASTARLIAAALEARIELKAGASVGHAALETLAAAIGHQTSSRKLLIEAHAALNDVRQVVGLPEEGFGGGGDKEVPKIAEVLAMPARRTA